MADDQMSARDAADAKQWERPWSTSEIRKHSSNWTLAGDTGLLRHLQEYAQNLISRTHETEKLVNELVYKNKAIGSKVNNVINDFQMLSNEQFVENRVYDEEVQEKKTLESMPEIQKSKEQREAEMLPRVTQALELGISVLDNAFHEFPVETSDSEEDEVKVEGKHYTLEPKDPYEHRPLPFIIGSKDFHQDDYVGLRDAFVDDFVDKVIDEESASLASISSSSSSSLEQADLDLEDPYEKEAFQPPDGLDQNPVEVPHSMDNGSIGSEGSDLFDLEKEENDDFISEPEAVDKMVKENEPSRKTNNDDLIKEVKSLLGNKGALGAEKVSHTITPEKYVEDEEDDLFSSMKSEKSPFQRKSSQFATDLSFNNEKDDFSDDDLFRTSEKNHVISSAKEPSVKSPLVNPSKETKEVKETKEPNLFNESEDEIEDIFTTLSKKSFSLPPFNSTATKNEQNNTSKASNSVVAPVPDLTNKSNNGFAKLSDESSSDSLFGDDPAADDLFSTKPMKEASFDNFLSDDDNDLFSSLKIKPTEDNKPQKKSQEPHKKTKTSLPSKDASNLLFGGDDDEDFDLFTSTKIPPYAFSSPAKDMPNIFDPENKVSSNGTDLFKGETSMPSEDIFGSESKIPSSKSKEEKSNIFQSEKRATKNSSISSTSEDTPDLFVSENKISSKSSSSNISNPLLESPPESVKNSVKDTSAKIPDAKKATSIKYSSPEKKVSSDKSSVTSGGSSPLRSTSLEKTSEKKLPALENCVDLSVSFEDPIDSHSTLSAMNKGRAKIPGKRRKPSRRTRQASLSGDETSSRDEESSKKITETKSSPSIPSDVKSPEDSEVFTNSSSDMTSSLSDMQITPKKVQPFGFNKNIMSQLVSEIGSTKVGKRGSFIKTQEDDDDIFFSNAGSDSKTSDPSPKSPARETLSETSPTSNVTKTGITDNATVNITDSILEDDLFSESAFKGLKTNVAKSDSIFNLEDDDEDIFKVVDTNKQKKLVTSVGSSEDIFEDAEEDIFASVEKDKYEMFPNQLYDDDGDIFGNLGVPNKQTTSGSNTKKTSKIEAPKKVVVDTFDDPLSGFCSD